MKKEQNWAHSAAFSFDFLGMYANYSEFDHKLKRNRESRVKILSQFTTFVKKLSLFVFASDQQRCL